MDTRRKKIKKYYTIGSIIEKNNPDFIVDPGDFVNSSSCLETQDNRDAFTENIKRITGGRLMLCTSGNHERMILGPNGWIAVESTILQDTLSKLDNVIVVAIRINFGSVLKIRNFYPANRNKLNNRNSKKEQMILEGQINDIIIR